MSIATSPFAREGTPLERAVKAARVYRRAHGPSILRELCALLAIPNTSADAEGLVRNAQFLQEAFTRRRARMELLRVASAPPIVFGELRSPGAKRTLGIYMHYDGQPAGPDQWVHPPWEPTLYNRTLEEGGQPRPLPEEGEPIDPEWRLYARSASDGKAPFAALLAALDALYAADIAPTANLKFLFDGEEESGSPNLPRYLKHYGESYHDVDAWLFLDGPVHPSRRPQLAFGARGQASLELTVYGAVRPLHSGHYGNWAPVPGTMLAHLVASMVDEEGHVLIEGFYDGVEPVGEADRALLDAMPDYDDDLRQELGLLGTGLEGLPRMESLMLPSLTIRGLESGSVGETVRNVIPSQATASIDIRLAPGNDPEAVMERVEEHIRRQGYHIVRVTPNHETRLRHPKIARVVREKGYPAARTRVDQPLVEPIVKVVEAAVGQPPVLVPTLGGSLPLYLFTDVMEKPAVIVPIANHDSNEHAPNENLRLANLWYGVDLFAGLLAM
ncbi:MAG: M20/M25/M40 family metallo-hydrolase [Bacteroidetes bacterium]|nr:MAG: M20/M25/M40 family metallo-hydrolase [Bacteroidota bacterium]GIV57350.1 MAG: peptidase M20 [Rhodothermaceae bacterium]